MLPDTLNSILINKIQNIVSTKSKNFMKRNIFGMLMKGQTEWLKEASLGRALHKIKATNAKIISLAEIYSANGRSRQIWPAVMSVLVESYRRRK